MAQKRVKCKNEDTYKELIDTQAKALRYVNEELRKREKELEWLRRKTSRTVHLLGRIKHKLIDDRLRTYNTKEEIVNALERLYNDIIKLEEDMECTNDKDQEKP